MAKYTLKIIGIAESGSIGRQLKATVTAPSGSASFGFEGTTSKHHIIAKNVPVGDGNFSAKRRSRSAKHGANRGGPNPTDSVTLPITVKVLERDAKVSDGWYSGSTNITIDPTSANSPTGTITIPIAEKGGVGKSKGKTARLTFTIQAEVTPAPKPKVKIYGPDTLVSTKDGNGLVVEFKAIAKPPGGTFSWTWGMGSNAIEIVGPYDQSTLKVRAKAGQFSPPGDPADQKIFCDYTLNGVDADQAELAITVATPTIADVVDGGKTKLVGADKLQRFLKYQIIDQFDQELRERYSYTNSAGTKVTVPVIELLVSEKLKFIQTSNMRPLPTPYINKHAYAGRFQDEQYLDNKSPWEVLQWLEVHTQKWPAGGVGIGNLVRKVRIKTLEDNNPEKISMYDDVTSAELPERP